MSNDTILLKLYELKKQHRGYRERKAREEGRLQELLSSLKKELGTEDLEEAEEMKNELTKSLNKKVDAINEKMNKILAYYEKRDSGRDELE